MQLTYIFATVAVFMAVGTNALPRVYRRSNCRSVDENTKIGDTSGLVNNLLAAGALNDNSQDSDSKVVCDDEYDYDYHYGHDDDFWGNGDHLDEII
ncbi:hypothetical protein BCR43DRAFT_483394 [Syncephalastrum racemosum]|uniref:Uncharacterized protein n=1 Tax=Syncephalastrum racemosum TaxID=13706 RepID=A0A1X2HVD8_SYNRA|nr:hypothetical protein BCR43DRAFT_483394 [Syncephalastrum racemosum]